MAKTKKTDSVKEEPSQEIKIRGEGKYPLVPLNKIEIAERPQEGDEASILFFNPRSMESFDEESMLSIRESIRCDGLQQPPVCRAFTKDDKIIRIQLIAGERRIRSLMKLVEDGEDCYDDETGTRLPAPELYEFIPVKLHYNIDDERALRLAFLENHESKSLTISEEIALVERLTRRGLNQKQIAMILLGDEKNVTWVSQTGNFRDSLPDEAFQKLLSGQLSRHVAVKLMSFKVEDRQRLYEEAVLAEERETAAKIKAAEEEKIDAEDEAEIAESDAESKEASGDSTGANRAKRKAGAARSRAGKATSRKEKAQGDAGKITQSHIDKGASAADLRPKRDKPLSRPEIEEHWLKKLDDYCVNGHTDPLTGQEVPEDLLLICYAVVRDILCGERDPIQPIREQMIESEKWRLLESGVQDHLDDFIGDDD